MGLKIMNSLFKKKNKHKKQTSENSGSQRKLEYNKMVRSMDVNLANNYIVQVKNPGGLLGVTRCGV